MNIGNRSGTQNGEADKEAEDHGEGMGRSGAGGTQKGRTEKG